jgi:hypothetical protein
MATAEALTGIDFSFLHLPAGLTISPGNFRTDGFHVAAAWKQKTLCHAGFIGVKINFLTSPGIFVE